MALREGVLPPLVKFRTGINPPSLKRRGVFCADQQKVLIQFEGVFFSLLLPLKDNFK